MSSRNVLALFVGLLAAVALVTSVRAESAPVQITISPRWQSPGAEIPADFLGLSFETKMLLPDRGGRRFFRGDNTELVATFRELGIRSLRIGGNSVDNPDVAVPAEADIDSLYAFADAADLRTIYSVRLKGQTDPADAARIAKYIMDHHAARTTAITIGNEPNVYFTDYPTYRQTYEKFATAILAAAPTARLTGPSATPGKTVWTYDLINDIGSTGHVHLITQHAYPGGNAQKLTDPAAGRQLLLSPQMEASYQKFYDNFVPAARAKNLPYRLEEANSLFHGGASGVSNSFASALWALDFTWWWAEHGAAGVNFHTGDRQVEDEREIPGGYDAFWSAPSGFKLHPIAYAMKAFATTGAERIMPVNVTKPDDLNVVAYAAVGRGGLRTITIINRENGSGAREAEVEIDVTAGQPRLLRLTAPGNDAAALSGVTLEDATTTTSDKRRLLVHLPATSAALLLISSVPQ
jgi:hypothetical protein